MSIKDKWNNLFDSSKTKTETNDQAALDNYGDYILDIDNTLDTDPYTTNSISISTGSGTIPWAGVNAGLYGQSPMGNGYVSPMIGGAGGGITGGGSGLGQWTNTTVNTGYTNVNPWQSQVKFSHDVVISRPGKSDIEVGKTLEVIMDRLAILEPNFELMGKFPALKEAYENYKLIEAMCKGASEDDDTK